MSDNLVVRRAERLIVGHHAAIALTLDGGRVRVGDIGLVHGPLTLFCAARGDGREVADFDRGIPVYAPVRLIARHVHRQRVERIMWAS